jgi:hypothetical protein
MNTSTVGGKEFTDHQAARGLKTASVRDQRNQADKEWLNRS